MPINNGVKQDQAAYLVASQKYSSSIFLTAGERLSEYRWRNNEVANIEYNKSDTRNLGSFRVLKIGYFSTYSLARILLNRSINYSYV